MASSGTSAPTVNDTNEARAACHGLVCSSTLTPMEFSASRCVLTDTYSPPAMDNAPATMPATPAMNSATESLVAPATPNTRPAVDTMPSLAPSTPARSQFSRDASAAPRGSSPTSAASRALVTLVLRIPQL